MLKDITTIELTGANFDSPALFKFFDPNDGKDKKKLIKAALVYGKNGTGKSTIARAFRKLTGENVSNIDDAKFYNDNEDIINLTDEEKKHIFVFDEYFVEKNVKLQQDHLDTIVMLGQVADLAEKIEAAENDYKNTVEKYSQQKVKCEKYQNEQDVTSPKYYILSMKKALQGDDNWAGREKIIKGSKVNANVNDETYKSFINLKPIKSKADLLGDFQVKLGELNAVKSGEAGINENVPMLPSKYRQYDDMEVQELLLLKVEKPELSLREKKLLTMVQNGKSEELNERKNLLKKEETTECPFCYQPLSFNYKKSLVQSIEKVLKKEVTEHQNALKEHLVDQIDLELDAFRKLSSYQTCINLIDKINEEIENNNTKLTDKINNPYNPIITDVTNVKTEIHELNSKLEDLEKERVLHNTKVKQTDPIIQELHHINDSIAYYDVIKFYEQYNKQQEISQNEESLYNQLSIECREKRKTIENLTAQKNSVKIAVDLINSCLKYIFFSDNRLKIEYVHGVYKLLSNGKSVKPCDVSVGERNIIGLCYFFANICEGKEEESANQGQYILVIDDPISSYDEENRVGILSFLRYKLSEFLEGNQNTKALIMTHELMTFYDLHKILEEIIKACKKKNYPMSPKFNGFEIMMNGELKRFEYNQRQEYTESLKIIYDYACGKNEYYSSNIGNMMRQVLEAFSTFEYRKSIVEISTDDEILSLLGKEEYIKYFKYSMYRLVLNGESHKEEQVKSMNDLYFFDIVSEEEKRRTAKDILCFIYLLNSQHLLEHLKGCSDVKETIESWCQQIG